MRRKAVRLRIRIVFSRVRRSTGARPRIDRQFYAADDGGWCMRRLV